MTPDEWTKVKALFDAALALEPSERAAFLAQECPDDHLRHEVEKLLANHEEAGSFLSHRILASEIPRPESGAMIGRTLSHYQIIEKLGEGGMGVVYRARDTRLNRMVALKILPADVLVKPDRKLRFIQEARTASSLNHSNIVTVYDIDACEGLDFIAMEYVAGKTLGAWIGRKGLKIGDVLRLSVQIADAVSMAHAAGIVHRDLKPTNVMVTENGTAKVLDFGLAKLVERAPSDPDAIATEAMGEDKLKTEEGLIVGTVAYMSPEQAEGKVVDGRSDIFSFGALLYEMVTGRRAFQGESRLSTLSAVLHSEPKRVSEIAESAPPELEKLIGRCLRKDRERRIQHMVDVRLALEEIKEESESQRSAGISPRKTKPQRWLVFIAAAVFLFALIAFWLARPLPPPRVLGSTQITRDGHQKISSTGAQSLWTDGSRLYFNEEVNGNWRIAQVSVLGGETLPLPTSISTPLLVSMAPNRSELLVASMVSTNNPLTPMWITSTLGGTARRFGSVLANDGAFSPDGRHVVYLKGGPEVYQANLDGTESHKLLTAGGNVVFPRFSPDGSFLRFVQMDESSASIWEVRSDGSGLHPILPDWNKPHHEGSGSWTPDGRYYIFEAVGLGSINSNLWTLREKRGLFVRQSREPAQLTFGPLDFYMPVPSNDGRKLYAIGVQRRGELARYDAKSRQFQPFLPGIWADQLAFSSDGQWMAYVLYPEGNLWRSKADGSQRLQLTFPPTRAFTPSWSPDDRWIVFSAARVGNPEPFRIYSIAKDGGDPEVLASGNKSVWAPCWSAGGKSLVFGQLPGFAGGPPVITVLDLKTRQASVLPGSEGLWLPGCSPDGRYISALTTDSQAIKVFNTTTRRWKDLIKAPVNSPAWSRDSQHIYFDSYPTRDAAVFRIRVSDHKLERVANLEDFRRAESMFLWPWTGLAPDDSPLLVRDIGTQEIYALDWEAP